MTNVAERRQWIDIVRALCVMAIVLMHFQIWVLLPTMLAYPAGNDTWNQVFLFLAAFRMPALFVVSGILVADRVRRGWGERRNAVRALSSFYLYFVWLAIYAVFAAVFYSMPGQLVTFVTHILVPHSTLWFILFLAINVVVMTTLHRVHPALVMGALGALSILVLASDVGAPWDMLARGAHYMLFFAIGVYFKSALVKFASGGLWWKIPGAVLLLLVMAEAFKIAPYRQTAWFGLYLVRDAAAVLCAIAVASAITYIRPIAVVLSYLGRRTLPIYVLHYPVILVIAKVRDLTTGDTSDSEAVWILGPAVGVVAVIAICLILGNLLTRIKLGGVLFRMPARFGDLILGKPAPETSSFREISIDAQREEPQKTFEEIAVRLADVRGFEAVAIVDGVTTVQLDPEITDTQLEGILSVLREEKFTNVVVQARL